MITYILISILSITTFFLGKFYIESKMKQRKLEANWGKHAPNLEVCYVDKLGNKWYKMTNFLNIPTKRAIEAKIAHNHADLCVSPEVFDSAMNKLVIYLNQKNTVKASEIVTNLQHRRTYAADEQTLLNLINCYFLLEGEPAEDTNPYWFDKKKEIFSKDKECYAFFLNSSFLTLRNVSELSDTGILDYLQTKAQDELLSTLK